MENNLQISEDTKLDIVHSIEYKILKKTITDLDGNTIKDEYFLGEKWGCEGNQDWYEGRKMSKEELLKLGEEINKLK